MKKNHKTLNSPQGALNDRTTKMQFMFIIIFAVNLCLSLGMAMASSGKALSVTLFGGAKYTDQFMDFLNSIRDNNQTNVYYTRGSIYPPLAVIFFRLIATLLSSDIPETKFADRYSLLYDHRTMLIFVLFVVLSLVAIDKMIDYRMRDAKIPFFARLSAFCLVIAYPVLYCIERGNIVILCVVTSMFFFFFRDSENKVIRELSYISLAISAGLKFYPAIFGLILIIEKKYKDAARLILYGILFVVVPFIIINRMDNAAAAKIAASTTSSVARAGGITGNQTVSSLTLTNNILPLAKKSASDQVTLKENLDRIIYNIKHFFKKKTVSLNFSEVSIQNIFCLPWIKKALGKEAAANWANIALYISEGVAFFFVCTAKKEWERVFLMTYIMLNIPAASSTYSLSFIIIPFALFLADKKEKKKVEWLSAVMFSLLVSYIPVFWINSLDEFRKFTKAQGLGTEAAPARLFGGIFFQILFLSVILPEFIRVVKFIINKLNRKSKPEVKAEAVGSECQ